MKRFFLDLFRYLNGRGFIHRTCAVTGLFEAISKVLCFCQLKIDGVCFVGMSNDGSVDDLAMCNEVVVLYFEPLFSSPGRGGEFAC